MLRVELYNPDGSMGHTVDLESQSALDEFFKNPPIQTWSGSKVTDLSLSPSAPVLGYFSSVASRIKKGYYR